MNLRQLEAPTAEPISLEEAKLHLRISASMAVSSHPEDAKVQGLITAAREIAEAYTGRIFADAVYEYRVDAFPGTGRRLKLPVSPVGEVLALEYVNDVGVLQEVDLSAVFFDDNPDDPAILTATGAAWPAAKPQPGAVRVRFRGWYGAARPTPAMVKAAIFLTIGDLYENRENQTAVEIYELPSGHRSLLAPHRAFLSRPPCDRDH